MEKVLKGIRVLDFSRFAAGPYCGMLLADMGAEVIRVENPGGSEDRKLGPFAPNGESLPFSMTIPRNKKGITLKLRSVKGREILKELVQCSDVVLHNFTSGSEEASILDYESLREINPKIILVSVTGFGATGPFSQQPCFDSIAQAISGAMSYTGFPGNPPTRAAVAYVDFGTAVHAALGTVLALYHRLRTGNGQMVDLALMDIATSFTTAIGVAAEYKILNYTRPQIGNHSFYNFTDSFQSKDGWLMISAITNPIWRRLLRAIGREDLKDDPRFKDDMARFQNRHAVQSVVSQWIEKRTTDEAVKQLEEARVPCSKVNTIAEMMTDPRVKTRDMIVDMEYPGVGKVPVPGIAIKMSQTPGEIERRAPQVGEHNKEIYCDLLGFSQDSLSHLKAEGIV